jgi:hypothetical protein
MSNRTHLGGIGGSDDRARLIKNVIEGHWVARRLTRVQSWVPRSSLPGNLPVSTPSSNVTDPRLIV